jgi:hypothetical protein
VSLRSKTNETNLSEPLLDAESVNPVEPSDKKTVNTNNLLLYFDFEDDLHELTDSDFTLSDEYQSDSESAWFDDLPDDDVYVSERDYPILYLTSEERQTRREQQISGQTSNIGPF